jgi:hypothetical protein
MFAEQTREGDPSVAMPSQEGESTTADAPPARQGNEHGLNLAAHPRAARRVTECKAWGGLAGFFVGGYLSLSSNTLLDAAFRALLTGIVCYVAVWGAAVFIWRRLIVAELRQREHELSSERAKRSGLAAAAGENDPDAAPAAS